MKFPNAVTYFYTHLRYYIWVIYWKDIHFRENIYARIVEEAGEILSDLVP